MPDVAAHETDDMRLPEQRDRIIDPSGFEPAIGNNQAHNVT
jgi:hypothetical protein